MADETLTIRIVGDTSSYEKAVTDAEQKTKSFEARMGKIASKISSIGDKISSFGTKLTVGITTPLALAGKSAVTAASDFDENLNKVEVAFGDCSAAVKNWADDATESFGLSKNQALEATALFGDMATSMGLSQAEAAHMSMLLAGLAGDLASFKNIGIDQAMTALNGVFTGETESLKQLGIVMTEVNLQEFADGMGLVYDEMSQAEKVQLRYNYVMEQSANAQGDYARTSDGTANSMRTFQASVENLGISLGQYLLPLITPLIQKATEMVNAFANADPELQQLILKIAGIAAVAGPALVIFGKMVSGIGAVTGAVGKLSTGIKALGGLKTIISGVFTAVTSPAGLAVIAIAAVIAIGYLLIKNWDEVKAKAGETWDWIQQKMQDFDNFLTGIFTHDWTENFGVWGNILNGFFATVSSVWSSIKQVFSGIIDFVGGVFTGDWDRAWSGIVNIFGGLFGGIVAIAKSPLNGVISVVNSAIDKLNTISVHIPDWVPLIGGKGFEVNIPKIPYLAHGTENWQGGFAYMNEGGRGELTYLPNGAQVIPHDISVQYAKAAARANSGAAMLDLSGLLEGMIIQVINHTNVDGTPLKESVSDYTIRKIGNQQKAVLKARGAGA